ncbi:MAG: hypothetical protein ACK5SM_08755, partial [Sphingomonadales bacterium]
FGDLDLLPDMDKIVDVNCHHGFDSHSDILNRSDASRQAVIDTVLKWSMACMATANEKQITWPQIIMVKLTRTFQPQCKQFGGVNIIRLFINHYKPAGLGQSFVSKTGPIDVARSDEIQFKKEVN